MTADRLDRTTESLDSGDALSRIKFYTFPQLRLFVVVEGYAWHDYHLYRSAVKGKLFEVLKSVYPNLTKGIVPEIYHFALYTVKNGLADRTSDIRSPRIYFVLGDYGRIYPLFFDPYHELNPVN